MIAIINMKYTKTTVKIFDVKHTDCTDDQLTIVREVMGVSTVTILEGGTAWKRVENTWSSKNGLVTLLETI